MALALSNAVSAYGTILAVDDGTFTNNWTNIAEVRDIAGPDLKFDVKEVTTHASPSAAKERLPTLLDIGTITFTINYIANGATHAGTSGLVYLLYNRTRRGWKVVFPVNTVTWAFNGYVTQFKPDMKVDAELTAQVTITMTSASINPANGNALALP